MLYSIFSSSIVVEMYPSGEGDVSHILPIIKYKMKIIWIGR